MANEQILEKIKKLFAKANDRATTEAEAAAFMSKVLELLAANNLEENFLFETEDPMDFVGKSEYEVTSNLSWFQRLGMATAKLYFSSVYVSIRTDKTKFSFNKDGVVFGKKTYYVFVGREANRITAMNMYDYFIKSANRMAKSYPTTKEKYEFVKGICFRLMVRIHDLIEASQQAPKGECGGLPALYDAESKAVQEYMDTIEGRKPPRSRKMNLSNNAFIDGWNAGEEISLNTQVAAASAPQVVVTKKITKEKKVAPKEVEKDKNFVWGAP